MGRYMTLTLAVMLSLLVTVNGAILKVGSCVRKKNSTSNEVFIVTGLLTLSKPSECSDISVTSSIKDGNCMIRAYDESDKNLLLWKSYHDRDVLYSSSEKINRAQLIDVKTGEEFTDVERLLTVRYRTGTGEMSCPAFLSVSEFKRRNSVFIGFHPGTFVKSKNNKMLEVPKIFT